MRLRQLTLLAGWLGVAAGSAAWADGGTGGRSSVGAAGGDGGTGFTGNAGAAGLNPAGNAGSGGGGGGAGGGAGGKGGAASGGEGGAGGATAGANGGNGLAGISGSGGGGGGGGANGNGAGAASIVNLAPLTGGNGGNGGAASGGGGGGGAGGYGAIVTGAGNSSNSNTITGGTGGNGGRSTLARGGNGGDGGAGLQFSASGATFTNSGSITGGAGGAGADIGGLAGNGGVGISGSSISIINSGTIAGSAGANAIAFTGGSNTLTLQSGSTITGNIAVTGTLNFAQPTDATLSNIISGTGSVSKSGSGILTLTGANTYTGSTSVTGGTLMMNSASLSNVAVGTAGKLSIAGNYVQNGGVYQVSVNAAGQSGLITATGTATLNGGTVQVQAQSGTYAASTTYTILKATGGVTGTFSNVTSNFSFLTPTLSYDASNVFLTLVQARNAFSVGAQTGNQRAVGRVLDTASPTATGDFLTVINALALLSTQQGPAALNAISGQAYSGFGAANISSGVAFMNALGQQMGNARGSSGGGTRVALAEACEVACDDGANVGPWSVWGSALGATGSIAGNKDSGTLTYNLGGVATGIDYRLDPHLLVGLGIGFGSGNQWVGGLNGQGTSDSYNGSLYASFTPGAFYLDALAGYGYSDNQMTRMIVIPGLAPRTARGRTGANQLTGQVETGYKLGIYEAAAASLTPFVRFQAMSVNQNGFSETGADSLNLNVAPQTTNSVRSVIGAELAGALDLGWRDKLALTLRLGWAHEYADTSRPVTAAFAGAPGLGFTVYGVAPQRDAATIGLALSTSIAQSTGLYLRYDGEFSTGAANHVLSAGLRMSW